MEAGNKSMSPNIEASDTEMIEFRKEKASLIHIHIERRLFNTVVLRINL